MPAHPQDREWFAARFCFYHRRPMRSHLLMTIAAALLFGLPAQAQPSNVVLDGAPPVPDELKERIRPYLDSRAAELASIADDGSALLVATRFAETYQIHLVRAPLGMRRQLTFRADTV